MLRKFQAERLKIMKTDLGVYGEAWAQKLYPDQNIYYEGGPPHKFWLHVDSRVVWQLTMFIKLSKPDVLSEKEFSELEEGSLVLARYSEDEQIYRAQVEQVKVKEGGGQKTVLVRFLDYGNSDEVGVESLFRWEERYDQIKPQAVACRLASSTHPQLSPQQTEEFSSTMRSCGKLRLRVVKVLHSGDSVSACLGGRRSGPDLVVQMFQDDLCVETRLKQSMLMREMFTEPARDKAVISSAEAGMSFMEKVELYLGYQGERETPPPPEIIQNPNRNKKNNKKEKKASASVRAIANPSPRARTGGLKAEIQIGQKEVKPQRFIFPSEDIRPEFKDTDGAARFIPPQAEKSPDLKIQLQEVFTFRIASIKSTEEFYIFPGQTYRQRLDVQPRRGEKMIAAKLEEVKVDSVWMVRLEVLYERGQVVQVDREAGTVDLQWIDGGFLQSGVPLSQLFRVPDGPARDLPGLVVRCHLAGIFSCSSEATETMKDLCPFSRDVQARLTESFNGESFGLDVFCPNLDIFNDVLVSRGLAEVAFREISSEVEMEETEAGGDTWDPMAEDYLDSSNNYKTTDEDVGFATDGYKSRQAVCAQFFNTGRCYKGELCGDRHVQLRPGAVTADQEEVIITTLDQPVLPTGKTSVLLRISHVHSPSSFYVTFPHGDRNIFTLSEAAKKATVSGKFEKFSAEMQESYQSKSRAQALDSLPSSGTLLAVRLGSSWHRASVVEEEDEERNIRVFLVDIGRLETVPRGDVRRLQDNFTILPFQAHEAELNMLEPQGGTWRPEAGSAMKSLAEGCDHLSGKVVKVLGEKLVMDVSTIRGEGEEQDIGQMLCDGGLANRLVESERKVRIQSLCPC